MKLHILHNWSKWEQIIKEEIKIFQYYKWGNRLVGKIIPLEKHCLICNKTKYKRVTI